MKIKGGFTVEQLEECAKRAGHFKLENVRREGNYVLFVLRMASSTPTKREREWLGANAATTLEDEGLRKYAELAERMQYRKKSFGRYAYGRGPEYGVAVCFHGFKAFMDEVFKRNPKAIIRTAKASYLGVEDFERKWISVGEQNVGSQCCPARYGEMCDC